MGLVNLVIEPEDLDARTLELASEIAGNAPLSLAGNKRVIRTPSTARWRRRSSELIDRAESCFRSEDFREGVRAFGEKRKPVWRGR